MNETYSLRLEADYKGQVAGLPLPLQSCFSLKYWIPLATEEATGVTVFVRDVETRESIYERHYDLLAGEVLLEDDLAVGEGCRALELIVIADNILAPPIFIVSPNNNLTIHSVV